MKKLLTIGGQDVAPAYLSSTHDFSLRWSGKKSVDLSEAEILAIQEFAMHEAWDLGYYDFLEGRDERVNPFHLLFLHGVPSAMFNLFYRRGQAAGKSQTSVYKSFKGSSPREDFALARNKAFATHRV